MRFVEWVKEEAMVLIPAIIYFALAFNLIHYTYVLGLPIVEKEQASSLQVTLFAILIGKVLLIAGTLPFIKIFDQKPLIYNIFLKLIIYMFFCEVVWSLETFLRVYWHSHNTEAALARIWFDYHLPQFWVSQLWLLWLFFCYLVFAEFCRVLGQKQVLSMLFGKK